MNIQQLKAYIASLDGLKADCLLGSYSLESFNQRIGWIAKDYNKTISEVLADLFK